MLKSKKNSLEQNLFIINTHIKKKSFNEAKEICLELLKKFPNNYRLRKILTSLPMNYNSDVYQTLLNKLTMAFNSQNYDFVIDNGLSYLKIKKNDTNINNLVAAAYLEKKQYILAINHCDIALKTNPNNHLALNNRGVAKSNLKRYLDSIQDFKEAINIQNKFVEAYLGSSNNFFIINKNREAIKLLENAPEEIYKNINIQKELSKHSKIKNYEKAKYFLHEVIKKEPDDGISLFNLHTFYFEMGDYNSSCKYLVEAYNSDNNNLRFNIALAEIYLLNYYTGRTLNPDKININYNCEQFNDNYTLTDLDKCKYHLDRINKIDPTYLDNNYTYIMFLFIHRETEKAIKYLKKYIETKDFENTEEMSSKVSAYLFLLLHSENFSSKYIFNEHVKFGSIFENKILDFQNKHKNILKINKALKVGFVSKDFKDHAAKSPILTIWKNLKKFNIEIHAFNNAPLVTYDGCGEFKKYIHTWYDIFNLNDAQLAEYIFNKEIDILIDLSGHTDGNRLPTFAYKPSPIQISCVGYPGTTGLKNIDYILCDERIAPKNLYDHLYVEKLLRIPTAAAWAPLLNSPNIKKLPALKNKYITFGSFNYPRKVTKKSIRLWSKILFENPNSILVQAAADSLSIKENFKREFEENGIKAGRIQFIPRLKTTELLHYLNDKIDISLDNTMYTGGTTTNYALWMGVPVVTLRGENRVQGQSASCLEHVGLKEFIAETEDEYVSIANFYSKNLNKLNEIRLNLRTDWENSKWRDTNLVSNGFGTALRKVWENYCENKPVKPLEITQDEIVKYLSIDYANKFKSKTS